MSAQNDLFKWDIIPVVRGFTWSITLPQAGLSIGTPSFTVHSEDDLSLQPSGGVPSQTWFFEKYEHREDDKVHTKSQVKEGNYYFESCSKDGLYMVGMATAPRRITNSDISATSDVTNAPKKTKFSLQYQQTKGLFTLTFAYANDKELVFADGGENIALRKDKGTNWVLLPNENGDGYYICNADAGEPHKVISSRTVADNNDEEVLAIDTMSPGNLAQLWKPVSAH
ncbi:hypothetical protein CPB86DRAFT_286133 [Serendipita vermifera]|nr:hypothetical protein CPB86DRAFT_286133 [Serendipita vermifera]